MSAYKRPDRDNWWWYRKTVKLPDGRKVRIHGPAPVNTKASAERAERDHIARLLNPPAPVVTVASLPTLEEWFNGRFWTEWVLGEGNRAGTQGEKRSWFENHIKPALGHLPIDQIDRAAIQRFKAELATKKGRGPDTKLSPKSRSNILAVLSKALRYAEESEMVAHAPRVRLGKVEKPDVTAWEFAEYARLVAAAEKEGPEWKLAVLLAGEAGLRVGELLALTWERDLDLVANTLSVSRAIYQGKEGPTKGGRSRTVPMTSLLRASVLAMPTIRRGRVLRSTDGSSVSEGIVKGHRIYRICRVAGLPERSWHTCRHAFATHAAQFGVNPWRLQAWLGHAQISQTMRYVSHADTHRRQPPHEVLAAGAGIADPDERIIAMLGVRVAADYSRAVAPVWPQAPAMSANR